MRCNRILEEGGGGDKTPMAVEISRDTDTHPPSHPCVAVVSPMVFCLSPSPTFSLLLPHSQVDVNQTSKVRVGGFFGGGTVEKTPLYAAAEKGSTEIAALLIEAKVRSVCVGGEVKQ